MKTASEHYQTHTDLHIRFRRGGIGVRAFEKAIEALWIEARADGAADALGEMIKTEIKTAMAETRAKLRTERNNDA